MPPMFPQLHSEDARKFHGPHMGILAMLIMLLPTARSTSPSLPKCGPCGEQAAITGRCEFEPAITMPMPDELSYPNLKLGPDYSPAPSPVTMLGLTSPNFRPGRSSDAAPARPAAPPGTNFDLGPDNPLEFQQSTLAVDRRISDPTRPKFGPGLPPALPLMSRPIIQPGPSSTAGPSFVDRAPFSPKVITASDREREMLLATPHLPRFTLLMMTVHAVNTGALRPPASSADFYHRHPAWLLSCTFTSI